MGQLGARLVVVHLDFTTDPWLFGRGQIRGAACAHVAWHVFPGAATALLALALFAAFREVALHTMHGAWQAQTAEQVAACRFGFGQAAGAAIVHAVAEPKPWAVPQPTRASGREQIVRRWHERCNWTLGGG